MYDFVMDGLRYQTSFIWTRQVLAERHVTSALEKPFTTGRSRHKGSKHDLNGLRNL